jgi:hypothetical protein
MKHYSSLLLLSFLFFGCLETDDTDSENEEGKPLQVVLQKNVASSKTDYNATERIINSCGEQNGYAIVTGYDKDGDGFLDSLHDKNGDGYYDVNEKSASEVVTEEVFVLCDGVDGKDVIVSQIYRTYFNEEMQKRYDEVNETCGADGGVVVSIGFDLDGDEVLDVGEVNKFTALCGSKNLYIDFDKDVANGESTLTIINNDANAESVIIKDGKSPTVENSYGEYNSSCVDITDVSGEKYKICSPKIVEIKDGNKSFCDEIGGVLIYDEVTSSEQVICNGKSNIDIQMNILEENGKLYLNGIGIGDMNTSAGFELPNRETTIIEEDTSPLTCPNGDLKISTFIDKNINGTYEISDGEKSSYLICKPEAKKNFTKPVATVFTDSISDKILFSFSVPMNPMTVNSSSVFLECNSSQIGGDVSFNYELEEILIFEYLIDKSDFKNSKMGDTCEFRILKYVEADDENRTRMANDKIEINLNIPEGL